jgi:hypothetical protein
MLQETFDATRQRALRARVRCLEMLMDLESAEVATAAQKAKEALIRPIPGPRRRRAPAEGEV